MNPIMGLNLSLQKFRGSDILHEYKTKLLCYWKPPPQGYLKLNVNNALFFNQKKVGVGVILRNEKGAIVTTASKVENEVSNSKTMALPIFQGLQFCIS